MARGRVKKVGLTRMDAAIDALIPLGFSKSLIRHTVNSLLEVYEGDSGWIFIEEASYKLLIETILEKQEKECVMKEDGKEMLDPAETSAAAAVPELTEWEEGKELPDAQGDEPKEGINSADGTKCSSPADERRLNWKDISCMDHDQQQERTNMLNSAVCDSMGVHISLNQADTVKQLDASEIGSVFLQPPGGTRQCGKRKPCYGWIGSESSDDEMDLVFLETESSFGCQVKKEQSGQRKTRWDVIKPGNV